MVCPKGFQVDMQIVHLEIVHPLGNFHAVQTGRLDPGTELDKEMELNEARGVGGVDVKKKGRQLT